MTDGIMRAYPDVYGAWGYQALDRRDGPSGADIDDLTAIHNRRLEMLCNSVKGKGITIWVIGFQDQPPTGTDDEDVMSTQLQGCANSRNHWTMAYNSSQLRQKFRDIAKNIGGLRLSN